MAGRRPLPTALKILNGNPGHRPLNDAEITPAVAMPEMPRTLSRAARREWHFITRKLLALGILTEIDGKALAAYCEAYAEWEQACLDVKKYGQLIEEPVINKMGEAVCMESAEEVDGVLVRKSTPLFRLKENPAVRTRNNAAKTMKAFLIEFGLTPATRAKLKIGKKADDEPVEDFFNRARRIAGDSKPLLVPATAPALPESVTEPTKTSVQPPTA